MAIQSYQVTGLTHLVTATSSSSSINVTPTEAGTSFSGAGGPYFLKITNGSATENIYFATGTANLTATIPTGEGANAGSCVIPAYAEVIVQVASQSTTPTTIYVASIAANSSPVYITPVALLN
jgi:hypothetical protein